MEKDAGRLYGKVYIRSGRGKPEAVGRIPEGKRPEDVLYDTEHSEGAQADGGCRCWKICGKYFGRRHRPFLRGGAFLSPRLINNHLSPLDITILYLLITMLLERSYWKNIQLTSHNIKKPAPVFVSGAGRHSPGKRDFGCQAGTIFR